MKKRERKYLKSKKVNKGILHYVKADKQSYYGKLTIQDVYNFIDELSSCKGDLVWADDNKSKVRFEKNKDGRFLMAETIDKV